MGILSDRPLLLRDIDNAGESDPSFFVLGSDSGIFFADKRGYGVDGFQIGDWLVQPKLGRICRDGVEIRVEPKAMDVLVCLAARPGEVVAKAELLEEVWPDTFVTDDALKHAVLSLRKAFNDKPKDPEYIETIPRRGYRLIAEVKKVDFQPPEVEVAATGAFSSQRLLAASAGLVILLLGAVALNVGGLRNWIASPFNRDEIHSLAVLPLADLSNDPDEAYFVDGMTEALITELSRIPSLRVISRTSVMQYRGGTKPLSDIGRELHVDAVVEGSVMRQGDQVRITAQLIRIQPEEHLWAESYERGVGEVFRLQREVSAVIAREVNSVVGTESAAEIFRQPENPEANEAYLRGRFHWNKRSADSVQLGLRWFKRAIELDPNHAPAYAGIADSYLILAAYLLIPPETAVERAREAAQKALELDPTLAEAHSALAGVRQHAWDWKGAEEEFQTAIRLNPNYANAFLWYAEILSYQGRHEESVGLIQTAKELDPLSPVIYANFGVILVRSGRVEEGIRALESTLELSPDFPPAYMHLGFSSMRTGDWGKAVEFFQKGLSLSEGDLGIKAALGASYAKLGERERAMEIVSELEAAALEGFPSSSYMIASVYACLGNSEKSYQWLEKSFSLRENWLPLLGTSPQFESLRGEPRFQEMLDRIGLYSGSPGQG